MNYDGHVLPSGPSAGGNAHPSTELHCRAVPAEPQRLPTLRRALAGWAEHVGMSTEQVEQVALASYEALANVATHAYPRGGGVLDVHALYWPVLSRAEIVVTDYGRWQEPLAEREGLGGRGLVLIERLAEHAEVAATASGTSVRMSWTPRADTEVTRTTAS